MKTFYNIFNSSIDIEKRQYIKMIKEFLKENNLEYVAKNDFEIIYMWECFSNYLYAQFLVVTEETLRDFKNWLEID